MGATFYLAPAATVDLDFFVALPGETGLLVSLSPIYEYLKSHGCTEQDEYIVVKDWPVRMAALSFSEKVKIPEKLRDREKAIAAAGLRRNGLQHSGAKNVGTDRRKI